MNDKEFLEHVGILGMRWGHRKGSSGGKSGVYAKDGKIYNKQGKEISEDSVKKVRLKSKQLEELSNTDIRALNERLQLEKQYKDLTKAEVSLGKMFVKSVLTKSTQEAASLIAKNATPAILEALKKAMKTTAKVAT